LNFAFPAIVILVLLGPGFAFYSVYAGKLRRSQDTVISSTSVTLATLVTVGSSVPLHGLWIILCFYLSKIPVSVELARPVDLSIALILVMGANDQEILRSAITSVSNSAAYVALYFLTLWFAAFALGGWVRKLVAARKWDLKYAFLKLDNPWHYFFNGDIRYENLFQKVKEAELDVKAKKKRAKTDEDFIPRLREAEEKLQRAVLRQANGPPRIGAVYLSLTVELTGKTFLYVGELESYEIDGGGVPQWIALRAPVARRELSDDRPQATSLARLRRRSSFSPPFSSPSQRIDGRYKYIEGDYLVLPFRDVKTLNVDYVFFSRDPADSKSAKGFSRTVA
jgi:hypothetical protein